MYKIVQYSDLKLFGVDVNRSPALHIMSRESRHSRLTTRLHELMLEQPINDHYSKWPIMTTCLSHPHTYSSSTY